MIADAALDASEVAVVTMLRFWGEVIVSVEYGAYWKRMAKHFDPPDQPGDRPSRFYFPHYAHDGSDTLEASSVASIYDPEATHAGRLGGYLKSLLGEPGAAEAFAMVESRILEIRLRFYDQFGSAGHCPAAVGPVATAKHGDVRLVS